MGYLYGFSIKMIGLTLDMVTMDMDVEYATVVMRVE